jgi:hypothetical protein
VPQQLRDERVRVQRSGVLDVLLCQDGQVEALLAAEVARDQRRVDAGALADVADGGTLVAARVKELARGG